jgi:Ran GTPase-activating protein (RanGAP) involved in mRNA processing and transport
LVALAGMINGSDMFLSRLVLETCNAGAKGMGALLQELATKYSNASRNQLSHLVLSSNNIGAASSELCNLVTLAGAPLIEFRVANSAPASINTVVDALAKHAPKLQVLDVSGIRVKPLDAAAIIKLVATATSLQELHMHGTKITVDELRTLVTTIHHQLDLDLFLGANSFGASGAKILASVPLKMTSIRTLDLRDNEIGDEGLAVFLEAMCSNTSVRVLNLDRNLSMKPSKARTAVTNALIKLLTTNSTLESFSFQGGGKFSGFAAGQGKTLNAGFAGQLKVLVCNFLFALGSNTTLTDLDISHHAMGNTGVSGAQFL